MDYIYHDFESETYFLDISIHHVRRVFFAKFGACFLTCPVVFPCPAHLMTWHLPGLKKHS